MFSLINDHTSIVLSELTNALISPVFDEFLDKYNFNPGNIANQLQEWLASVHQLLRNYHIKFECEKYVYELVQEKPLTKSDYRNAPRFYAAWLMYKVMKLNDFSLILLNKGILLCNNADVQDY